ncbi:FAD-dependent monooxygenase [Streptomyces sp. NPDC037389]|uniref:FAD-dependent monooxygenase n=1 Tax=Streptomyces sp. NPDC037389 TaxID=3155369 RepID=UPI0033E8F457
MTAPSAPEHEVLVVGAGPVGLALVLALCRAGVDAVAVDRDGGPTDHPKARVVSTRSMELLRRLGVADAVRARALPGDWTERVVVADTLTGPALLTVESTGRETLHSPEHRVLCTQDRLEHVLAEAVATVRPDAVRWRTGALAVTDRGPYAEVTVAPDDGPVTRHRARHVVLADGCRGLGAGPAVAGAGVRRRAMSQVGFRLEADLAPLVAEHPAFITYLMGGSHPAQLLVVDGKRDWIVSMVAGRSDGPADHPPERVRRMLSTVVGVPPGDPLLTTARLRGIRFYDIAYRVAERFTVGRIVRAGDAAHELPPTGAAGLNLGLADADALAWRLVAISRGWGGPALLEDYAVERRAIGERTARWARSRVNTVGLLASSRAHGDSEGMVRAERQLAVYLDHPGLDLGPLLPPGEPEDAAVLVDDWRAGSRAPRLLDHYGDAPVLVLGRDSGPPERWTDGLAAPCPVPLRVLSTSGDGPEGAALVRPDGYVHWRGRSPEDLRAALTSLGVGGTHA